MIFVLMALGLSLIFGLLGVVNFAHGSLFVLGAFAGYFVLVQTDNFWLALLVGPLFVGLVGLVVERFLVRPLYSRGSADDALLVTFGFSLMVLDAVRMIWGKRGVEFDAPSGFEGAIDLGFTLFPTYRLLVIGITLVVVLILRTFLAHRHRPDRSRGDQQCSDDTRARHSARARAVADVRAWVRPCRTRGRAVWAHAAGFAGDGRQHGD
jgi:branched-subunit amino acid ABC-type transport system permease component